MHAGAGGLEARNWAEILLLMYRRHLSDRGNRWRTVRVTAGKDAGIESATLRVSGEHAYGNLESERGAHRRSRLSPNGDRRNRMHTSLVGVDVAPDVGSEAKTKIGREDLRIDTPRATGSGASM